MIPIALHLFIDLLRALQRECRRFNKVVLIFRGPGSSQ